MTDTNPIPVTILTGFLGAGKTTLLNRILREPHGQRIAVIENEFGETGIDNELLFQEGEQIVEMNNGCICCTVRGDLLRILGDLADRRDAGDIRFDRVVIETTGLADPAPVAQTFFVEENIRDDYRLDAILTVVDAKHAPTQLDEHHEAQEQVGFADRILLSKTDLVDADALVDLEARLRAMNPRAPIQPVHFGETPLRDILDIHGFDLDAILGIEPDFLNDLSHEHDDEVHSFVYRSGRPFDAAKLISLMNLLIGEFGADLLRYKGILHIAGTPNKIVFQGVHMLLGESQGAPWREDEPRESVLVFIGRNLPREQIIATLKTCHADAR
jgi:G3E family GTPase